MVTACVREDCHEFIDTWVQAARGHLDRNNQTELMDCVAEIAAKIDEQHGEHKEKKAKTEIVRAYRKLNHARIKGGKEALNKLNRTEIEEFVEEVNRATLSRLMTRTERSIKSIDSRTIHELYERLLDQHLKTVLFKIYLKSIDDF